MNPDFPQAPINGINTWILEAAWHCRKTGMNAGEAARLIQSYDGTLRRPLKHNEVIRAVEKAFIAKLDPSVRFERPPELPAWNSTETARLHRETKTTVQDLIDASPEQDLESFHPRGILERLFPDPDGLVCIGESAYVFHTAPLREHRHLRAKQFITPAFMLETHGETQDGKLSMHAKSNTGPRRYIVCDFDEPSPEQHPAIIMHLSKFRPLTMALSSGGKSLHAWFPTTTSIEDDRLFWRLCIGLGADPALFRNHSQFVRMPNGTRNNGNRQSVVYLNLNPSALP